MKARSLAVAVLALVASACADNNASLKWGAICSPPDDCSFGESCDAQYIGPVEFDSSSTEPYLILFVDVANQRPPTDTEDQGQLDTATAYVRELLIEDDFTGAEVVVPVAYQVPTSGTSVVTLLIPAPAAAAGTIETYRIRMRGVWGDETSFETAAFVVPVSVCTGAGCLYVPTCALGGCPVASGQAPITCGT